MKDVKEFKDKEYPYYGKQSYGREQFDYDERGINLAKQLVSIRRRHIEKVIAGLGLSVAEFEEARQKLIREKQASYSRLALKATIFPSKDLVAEHIESKVDWQGKSIKKAMESFEACLKEFTSYIDLCEKEMSEDMVGELMLTKLEMWMDVMMVARHGVLTTDFYIWYIQHQRDLDPSESRSLSFKLLTCEEAVARLCQKGWDQPAERGSR